uniref:Peptidase S54 rhomboid domain-containing protein n=1 Tax=Attheya septentrionalis TaxID=420275 RepID=A0A7S2UJQ9_9STRA|mmetsp:Transcript_26445/g.47987  ORF Transcript_26445/g.47987 Transcript_26445/m.47987 type:complete len:306 (+) Transcript_26445:152-1069(+)
MRFENISIVILYALAVATSVNGFANGGLIGPTCRTCEHRGIALFPVNGHDVSTRCDAHYSKHHRCFLTNNRPLANAATAATTTKMTTPTKGVRGHRTSRLYSSSPIESSMRVKTTAVYALILISIMAFVGDNILRLPVFRTMYLYHRNWKWWQPITSTFCHGDKAHLSGNTFLLLLFGRSVEDELGSFGLVFSYIFCGVVSSLVSLAMLPRNTVSLGASGAVFGLFSVSIFSRLSLRDIFDWRKIIEVGVLGQFVVSRFLDEAKTAASGGIVGINHVAHLSGAVAGCAMVLILRKVVQAMEKRTN